MPYREGAGGQDMTIQSHGVDSLQTQKQRQLLDAIDQLRNCGLDNELSLPQLVVCGDQSAGKSSVLEALTEINFPRADTLCTRFATEIILRRAAVESINVKIIADPERTSEEQELLSQFEEHIADFSQLASELERVTNLAKAAMGIGIQSSGTMRTFARDILRIEIQGPSRPQFTVVDLPGIFQNEQNPGDKAIVDNLTHSFISKPRTICLAIITAMNDADNQTILTRVREVDPNGTRSLGIITKPDTLPPGSGNENFFIELARNLNKKYHFKLGWHVLKNRKFEESSASFTERNKLEAEFFSSSNFKVLGGPFLGIVSLRQRLSDVLFNHVKGELPSIRAEVDKLQSSAQLRLTSLGKTRATAPECRDYLVDTCQIVQKTCDAALTGNYEGEFFHTEEFLHFGPKEAWAVRRLRALVQHCNGQFARKMDQSGHAFHIEDIDDEDDDADDEDSVDSLDLNMSLMSLSKPSDKPIHVSYPVALEWVARLCKRNRGRELLGNYNPLIIGELFWTQSRRWEEMAQEHVQHLASLVNLFMRDLLNEFCAPDVRDNLWIHLVEEQLQGREESANEMLRKCLTCYKEYPINYNHYYTDTIQKARADRESRLLEKSIEDVTDDYGSSIASPQVYANRVLDYIRTRPEKDMDRFSCEEALDGMQAIYKVKLKVFIDMVATLVIEAHLIRGMDQILSPKSIGRLDDADVQRLAGEPEQARVERAHLLDQCKKLEAGQRVLRVLSAGLSS